MQITATNASATVNDKYGFTTYAATLNGEWIVVQINADRCTLSQRGNRNMTITRDVAEMLVATMGLTVQP